MKKIFTIALLSTALLISGCGGGRKLSKDYTAFRASNPNSILVAPVINHSNEVDAADLFMTTLAVPLAERGYYVFPTNASKKLMDAEGLGDPGLIHQAPTTDLGRVFGADSIMYVEVIDWKTGYQVVNNKIQVEFLYTLKSAKDNSVLWQDQQKYVYSRSANTGNLLANMVANAIQGAINSTKRDFTPLAQQANILVLTPAGTGVPFGPRSSDAKKNDKYFPETGSGNISNATREAISAPGVHSMN
jgi:hypothetical protein